MFTIMEMSLLQFKGRASHKCYWQPLSSLFCQFTHLCSAQTGMFCLLLAELYLSDFFVVFFFLHNLHYTVKDIKKAAFYSALLYVCLRETFYIQ